MNQWMENHEENMGTQQNLHYLSQRISCPKDSKTIGIRWNTLLKLSGWGLSHSITKFSFVLDSLRWTHPQMWGPRCLSPMISHWKPISARLSLYQSLSGRNPQFAVKKSGKSMLSMGSMSTSSCCFRERYNLGQWVFWFLGWSPV